jgi:hypothetical protein
MRAWKNSREYELKYGGGSGVAGAGGAQLNDPNAAMTTTPIQVSLAARHYRVSHKSAYNFDNACISVICRPIMLSLGSF